MVCSYIRLKTAMPSLYCVVGSWQIFQGLIVHVPKFGPKFSLLVADQSNCFNQVVVRKIFVDIDNLPEEKQKDIKKVMYCS